MQAPLRGALSGGSTASGRTNDVHLLELSSCSWSQIPPTGTPPPPPRQCAAVAIAHGRYLLVHGGRNNFVAADLHCLDLVNRAWVEVGGADWLAPGCRPAAARFAGRVGCLAAVRKGLAAAWKGMAGLVQAEACCWVIGLGCCPHAGVCGRHGAPRAPQPQHGLPWRRALPVWRPG